VDQKNKNYDIFQAVDIITKKLPAKKIELKNYININSGFYVANDIKITKNIPEYNQSSMDGIGVSQISKKYKIVGKTDLSILNKKNIKKGECLIVKTGSLLNKSIKKVIPIEDLKKEKNNYIHLSNTKINFIRKIGHIVKKNTLVLKKNKKILDKDIQFIKHSKIKKIKIIKPLSFSLIATGNEFINNKNFKPTNLDYLERFLIKNNQIIQKIKIIGDNQKKLDYIIKNNNSNIIIVIGGTGKSEDDFNFDNKNLFINGLDLKPGKPFKAMRLKNKIIIFFPGNPCSNFVLTNILLKGILYKYFCNKKIIFKNLNKKIPHLLNKFKRKSFLFGSKINNSVMIFQDQESSNIYNIVKSNILVYYDKTKNLRYIDIDD